MQTQSIGVRLKSAREKTKLSLEDIATQGRLSIKRLIALENNQVDINNITAFDKSYLKKYCQVIGVVYDDLFHDLRVRSIDTRSLQYKKTLQPNGQAFKLNPKSILITVGFAIVGFVIVNLINHPIKAPVYVNNQVLIDNESIEQI